MLRILSLDDEVDVLDFVSHILEQAGYQSITATDDYEAWALLHTLPVDLFTQDLKRSGLTGWEFLDLLRADPALGQLPVMIVSGLAQSPDPGLPQVDRYFLKPFTPREWLAAVSDVCQQRGYTVPPAVPPVPIKRPHPARDLAPYLAGLHSAQAEVRLAGLRGVAWLPDRRLVEPALACLADPEAEVRLEAVRLLGRLGDDRAVEPLRQAWPAFPVALRWAVVRSLGHLKATPAVPLCLSALGDESAIMRMMAALALGDIGDDRAVEPIIATLADPDPWVSLAAITAAGRLGDPRALPALEQQVEAGGPVAEAAREAIALIRPEA